MTNREIEWVFYYTDSEYGVYNLYDIRQCSNPKRTKPAKELMQMLERNKCYTCGYMSLEKWEEIQK